MRDRFVGCLLGGMVADVAGAVVEGESRGYIAKTFRDVDQMLALPFVDEILGRKWQVGRYTDDTAMTLDVARWLIEGAFGDGRRLLELFCQSYDPGRRYGSGTAMILRAFPDRPEHWRALATVMFPEGSFGNGSAMRAAPIGCFFCHDPDGLVRAATLSSRTTHAHPMAVQGTVLQAGAVALSCQDVPPDEFCGRLGDLLRQVPQDTSRFVQALQAVEHGLEQSTPAARMAAELGTGVEAIEAVPMALYCFLSQPDDLEAAITSAIFVGGDTDTIASMAGSMAGARLGTAAVPRKWLARVREDRFTPARVMHLAQELYEKSLG